MYILYFVLFVCFHIYCIQFADILYLLYIGKTGLTGETGPTKQYSTVLHVQQNYAHLFDSVRIEIAATVCNICKYDVLYEYYFYCTTIKISVILYLPDTSNMQNFEGDTFSIG